jgi:pyridoxal 5-phosphate dependent beta-lyase
VTGSAGGATDSDWGWWRDRRPPATRLHLDTAAAGRSSRAVLAAAAAHAEREAQTGGYVAAAEAEPVLAEGRAALGKLLGVPADGVTFTRSGEGALGALLDS